jgi:hypothetical protein
MPLSFDVTRRALSLGSQDSVTGWYAKSFAETTIEVIFRSRGQFIQLATGMGGYAKHDLSGFTQDPMVEGDVIVDDTNMPFEVKSIDDYAGKLGNTFIFRECELAKLPLYYAMPSYGTAPTTQDPRQRSKTWFDEHLDTSILVKSDGVTPLSYITCWANPPAPYPIQKIFQTKGIDLVFSVDTPTSEGLPVGVGYIEHMPISVFCIDKSDVNGSNARWRGELALRTIAEDYPSGSLRGPWERMENNEQNLGSTTLYSVKYVLPYKRYA